MFYIQCYIYLLYTVFLLDENHNQKGEKIKKQKR